LFSARIALVHMRFRCAYLSCPIPNACDSSRGAALSCRSKTSEIHKSCRGISVQDQSNRLPEVDYALLNCNIVPSNHGRITVRTSHTQRRSSQPQLAAHPSLPNKHQSTPVANSVCLPILPSSLACACSPPSDHTRHVMS